MVFARHDPQVDLRLSRRRHLLVHRRHRLGHRPHLHRLRAARSTAPPASCSRAFPTIPTPAASGMSSTSTRSTSSTPPPPPSAPSCARARARQQAQTSRSLRLLGSVGEPINPEVWLWYHRVIGKGRCPIVDTWWQTETGGILITPLPGATTLKPGSATFRSSASSRSCSRTTASGSTAPASGRALHRAALAGHDAHRLRRPRPLRETYFSSYPGLYFTGDGCRRDEDGYYWITGRVDDVINVSGHRLGTAEVESALVAHPSWPKPPSSASPTRSRARASTPTSLSRPASAYTDELKKDLVQHVRKVIGPIATPDVIQWAPGLPKTRSGKIMRRILRKIAEGESDKVGDTEHAGRSQRRREPDQEQIAECGTAFQPVKGEIVAAVSNR